MPKKKKSQPCNLHKFFHYHEGPWSDRAVKIGASFVATVALLTFAGAVRADKSFAERSYYLSMLVPELVFPAAEAAATEEVITAPTPTEPQPTTYATPVEVKPTEAVLQTTEPLPPKVTPVEIGPSEKKEEVSIDDEAHKQNDEFDRQNVMRERKDLLREMNDQKREIKRACNQLKRMKNVTEDFASCTELTTLIAQNEQTIKIWSGGEVNELRDIMNEYRDLQVWDTLNALRAKIQLPQELNRFLKDFARMERTFKQKWVKKIPGLNLDAIQTKIAEIKNLHAEAKNCYTAGDFECAQEKLNEARETNYPGDLEGVLHQNREMTDMLRQIKDNDVKDEVTAILQPSIDLVNEGEWREANQEISPYIQELRMILQKMVQAQQNRRGISADITNRLNKLTEKQGGI